MLKKTMTISQRIYMNLSKHMKNVQGQYNLRLWWDVFSCSVMSASFWPMDCSSPGSSVHGDSSGRNTGVGCHALLQGSFQPGIEPRSPTLQADSLPSEPPEKPKNTGVGSLSVFQEIFPTQELNWSLLHCKWILHQLSYQGRPCDEISHT